MTITLKKIALFLCCLTSVFMLSTASNANYVYVNGPHYNVNHHYRHYANCRHVSGYRSHGYWHPAHRVCWR